VALGCVPGTSPASKLAGVVRSSLRLRPKTARFARFVPSSRRGGVRGPGGSGAPMTGQFRASPVSTPSRMRSGVVGTFRVVRFRTPRSIPLQRTPRFQGVSPLTSPLRSCAVSSIESLAPPMGFFPLQDPSTFAVGCDVQRVSQLLASGRLVRAGRRSLWRITVALPAVIPLAVALRRLLACALFLRFVPGSVPAVPPFQRFAGFPSRASMCPPPKR
jgi:hypothetical protein